jgi:RNAse (barnase) inhibitor barstar
MRELLMDGSGWRGQDDLYDAFFRAVGAPAWHGRNFNALRDSIGIGRINKIDVPYRIVIRNFDLIGEDALKMVVDFANLIRELAADGCPADIELRSSSGELVKVNSGGSN